MTKLIPLVLLVLLAGCDQGYVPPKADTGNPYVHSELVATVDGCKIWRLWGDADIYFAHCPDGPNTTQWTTSHMVGKMVRREVHQVVTSK